MSRIVFLCLLMLPAWIAVVPGLRLLDRIAIMALLALVILLSARVLPQPTTAFAFGWIGQLRQPSYTRWLGALALLISLSFAMTTPQPTVHVQGTDSSGNKHHVVLNSPVFDLTPSHFDGQWLTTQWQSLTYESTITLDEIHTDILLYSNHGDTSWWIDDELIATLPTTASNRFLLFPRQLDSGSYTIRCEIAAPMVPPVVSVSLSNIHAPGLQPAMIARDVRKQGIASFFGVAAFVLWLPSMNALFLGIARIASATRLAWAPALGIAATVFIVYNLSIPLLQPEIPLEADEAAFGLMAQQLLEGQPPPLFHYGQNYQGTFEVFPLAILMAFLPDPFALKLYPVLLACGTILMVTLTLWRFAGMGYALAGLVIFALLGNHFFWILGKAWFGYGFGIFCGSVITFLVLHTCQVNKLSAINALLLGLLGGIAFWQLPLIGPVLLSAFVTLLYHRWSQVFSNGGSIRCFVAGDNCQAHYLAVSVFVLACFPYWAPAMLASDSSSLEFIAEGRETVLQSDSSSALARLINVCIPVLLGTNHAYEPTSFIHKNGLATLLSVFFLVSLPLFVFASIKKYSLPIMYTRFALILILTTLLSVYLLPFGTWPWYLIPIYLVLPLVIAASMRWFWSQSKAIAGALVIVIVIHQVWSYSQQTHRLQNPTSLSSQGIMLGGSMQKIVEQSLYHSVSALVSEHGWDHSPGDAGRDWSGEVLHFYSQGSVNGVDRLSRRLPTIAQQRIDEYRVGYLIHNDLYYNHPELENPERYIPATMDSLHRLFTEILEYSHEEIDPWNLYVPQAKTSAMRKAEWVLDSNNPIFLGASHDHSISTRAYSRDTYWSSGYLPPQGGWLRITFPQVQTIDRVVLYHGTKSSDYPRENTVYLYGADGNRYAFGSLKYMPQYRSSILILDEPVQTDTVEIHAFPPEDNSWLTVFELWIQ